LGSGSSFAAFFSSRGVGRPASAQECANSVAQSGRTRSRPQIPRPTQDELRLRRAGSAGLEPLFAGVVLGIGALDPALGPFPVHTKSPKCCPDGLATDLPLGYALLKARLCSVVLQGPEGILLTELPRVLLVELLTATAVDLHPSLHLLADVAPYGRTVCSWQEPTRWT
jgi:hypothetical protein